MTEEEGEEFRRVAKLQYSEIARLRTALGQLQTENQRLVDWIMGEGPDALTTLQRIYSDPKTPLPHQISASKAAIDHERPKPTQTVRNVVSLFDYLERDRLMKQEAAKTIEHQPRKPIDMAEPTPETVLGAGCGHHQAYHEDGDPAA
jgi:hypothetical protein